MNVGNRGHRLGWYGGSGDVPALFFSETAAGSLGVGGDSPVPKSTDTPPWRGQFFSIPGVFNRPTVIKNAGSGRIQVLQDGLYMLNAYITTANAATNAETNIRFVRNLDEVIANSHHQIFEFGTNSDRDMIAKGVPVFLDAGDLVGCEVNSDEAGHAIESNSNWTIRLCTGLEGARGANGSYVWPATDAFYAYRPSSMGSAIDIQGVWHNAFEDPDTSIVCAERYDEQSVFDTSTGLWTPRAGKYVVSGCVSSENVQDTAFVEASLYNVTGGVENNWGFKGRNEGDFGTTFSNFACQISADGSTTYGLYARASNDPSSQLLGEADGYHTYLTAYRFSDNP